MTVAWTSTLKWLLLDGLIAGSTLVWLAMLVRSRRGRPLLERSEHRGAAVPLPVVVGVIGWLMLQTANRLSASSEPSPHISLSNVKLLVGVFLFIAALLTILLTEGGQRRLADVGLSFEQMGRQVFVGVCGFLAAVWPTGLLLWASQLWRSEATQHAYLQALRGESGGELLAWIVLSAVIAAPLAEELMFRVVLQGWLSERLSGPLAIGVTALIFALVHGWRDALPLVPLSLILGYLYDQSRRFWSCAVTHALFNAANLALALLTTDRTAS